MKYLCKQTTQHRDEGQIYLCEEGAVYDFTDKPNKALFQVISEDAEVYAVDFSKASEAELKEAKWKPSEAAEAIKATYDVELNIEKGIKKSEVITQIMDVRFRALDNVPTSATAGQ